MIAPHQAKGRRERSARRTSGSASDLPFRVELRDGKDNKTGRIVARAHSPILAEAIFRAACQEYPRAHLTLWHGPERLAEKKD
jgi:hypothetical protein